MGGLSNRYRLSRFFINQSVQSGEPIGHDEIIMKENKNEELQSRREFFKQAAKGALPILGAIALANMPLLAKAAPADRCYAGYACTGGCSGNCKGACKFGCSSCSGSCKGTCKSSSGR